MHAGAFRWAKEEHGVHGAGGVRRHRKKCRIQKGGGEGVCFLKGCLLLLESWYVLLRGLDQGWGGEKYVGRCACEGVLP